LQRNKAAEPVKLSRQRKKRQLWALPAFARDMHGFILNCGVCALSAHQTGENQLVIAVDRHIDVTHERGGK